MGVDSRRKEPADFRMLVWHVSEHSPAGRWIDAHTIPGDLAHDRELPDVASGTWASSSFDLLHGTDVSESPDTVPGDLLDELFGPHDDPRKKPGK